MTATESGVIAGHIKELLRTCDAVALVDWLAMVLWAQTHEDAWIEALTSLDTTEVSELLESMRREDAGPFAHTLVMLTARHANAFSDSDVREWLLADAVGASEQRIEMITQLRDELEAQVEGIAKRQLDEAALQAEIAQLERRRSELWLGEGGKRYDQVHKVEAEITRLETFERGLRAYDAGARQRLVGELEAEIAALKRKKKMLEKKVAQAIANRDQCQEELAGLEPEVRAKQDELVELRTKTDERRNVISRLNTEMDAALFDLKALQTKIDSTLVLQTEAHDALAQCQRLWRELAALVNSQMEELDEVSLRPKGTPPDMPTTGGGPSSGQAPSSAPNTSSAPEALDNHQTAAGNSDARAEKLGELTARNQVLADGVDFVRTNVTGRSRHAPAPTSRRGPGSIPSSEEI